jgi:superfamily II DNA/RNA helicase
MSFSSLGLIEPLQRAASEQGYSAPTPVQLQAIPLVLQGRDVLASAQTGSGKTAAFCLPVLQGLAGQALQRPRVVRALVLVPTRELAAQVGESARLLGQHLPVPLKIAVVFGGVSINPQMMGLRGGADMVVATPGRLLDLGFEDELTQLLALLPEQRQSLFFSATFPAPVQRLADNLLRTPARIEVLALPEAQPLITQQAIQVDAGRRTQLLRHLIQTQKWSRVLVFVATKYAAEIVADKLRKAGLEAEPFHGELSQGKRVQVLTDLKASRVQVVVATDVAARGLDVSELPVVVNYDLPRSSVDYVHRIGRTGRAGTPGLALSFISADTEAHFRLIEKRQGLALVREEVAGFEPVALVAAKGSTVDPDSNGGIKGKRPSKKDKLRAAAALAAPGDNDPG